MIGVIPIRDIEYEGTDQGNDDRSPVFVDFEGALAYAVENYERRDHRIFGNAWEVDLGSDPRIKAARDEAERVYHLIEDPLSAFTHDDMKDSMTEILGLLA